MEACRRLPRGLCYCDREDEPCPRQGVRKGSEGEMKFFGSTRAEVVNVQKTVKDPLKEGHHFDQSLGGIAGMFENIRSNTQVSV